MQPLEHTLLELAEQARAASRRLARRAAADRTRAIDAIAAELGRARSEILAANARDLEQADADGLAAAMRDRLALNPERLQALQHTVRDIAAQPDPLGVATRAWQRPNGLRVTKVRIPLGVVMMIYEARPNVTVDAAALCVRSGNAVILRGGTQAARSNAALCAAVRAGLTHAGLDAACVTMVPTQEREAIDFLLTLDDWIDLVIPRGGEALVRRVAKHSRIPVVKHYKGVCQLYVDRAADLAMALDVTVNAKVQRPGVCNALETLLVDAAVAERWVPECVARLRAAGVEVRGCEATRRWAPSVKAATDADWDTEYLDLVLAIRVVPDVDGAIAHIDAHGTQHTASIITADATTAARFTREVDASCVLVNASTRFNDGGELGLGAEMGISTTRVHAYGPMGVEALTAEKFVVHGNGQVRS